MNSAHKLNMQDNNIQPWHTPFLIWNQSVVPCPVLTVASWPADRFFKRQVRWSGMPIFFRVFQFIVNHTVKCFGIVNKAEIDVFWNSLAFSMIQWMLAICSLVPLPFLKPAWTSGKSIPFLSFIVPIFALNVPLVSLIFLKTSFKIFVFSFFSALEKCYYVSLYYIFFFSLYFFWFLLYVCLGFLVLRCLMVCDVSLICELYFLSLKKFTFVSFKNK